MSLSITPQWYRLCGIARNTTGIALLCMLFACGGGGVSVSSLPGSGGTGVTAIGPVSGFGSVIVNGIRFDDLGSNVQIDGQTMTPSQLRLGMVASVSGTKSSAAVSATALVTALGTANRIDVWSIAQGSVSSIVSPNTLTVAGMTLVVDAGTVFDGAASMANLSTSSIVKVWGQPLTSNFTRWAVTRLEVLAAPQNTVSTGKVSVRGVVVTLNGMTLVGSPAGLTDGQLLRAAGTASSSSGGTLTLSQATILADAGSTSPTTGYAELQGLVTDILGTNTVGQITRLAIGASIIDISSARLSPSGATIAPGVRIEVEGNWNAGVLIASELEVKSTLEQQEVEIEAVIESFTSVANFTVRGQRCDASGLNSVENGRLSDLRLGTKVHLQGVKVGDIVRVTELEIK
jgi:Domain of unknown function (DUF5666)